MEPLASARAGRASVSQPPSLVDEAGQLARQPAVLSEHGRGNLGAPTQPCSDLVYTQLRSGRLPVRHLRLQWPSPKTISELLVLQKSQQTLPPHHRLVLRHRCTMRAYEQTECRIGVHMPLRAECGDVTTGFGLPDLEVSTAVLDVQLVVQSARSAVTLRWCGADLAFGSESLDSGPSRSGALYERERRHDVMWALGTAVEFTTCALGTRPGVERFSEVAIAVATSAYVNCPALAFSSTRSSICRGR